MKKLILISALLFSFNVWAEDNEMKSIMFDDAIVRIKIPESFSNEAILGKKIFESNCIECHGKNAVGRKKLGPPLVHKIYEPSHHNDMTFYRAVEMGVRGHHWMFGNMRRTRPYFWFMGTCLISFIIFGIIPFNAFGIWSKAKNGG